MTESTYYGDEVPDHAPPEMQREISGGQCWKAIGIDDVLHFDFISPPPPAALIYALELLYSLHALDDDCALTTTGRRMLTFSQTSHVQGFAELLTTRVCSGNACYSGHVLCRRSIRITE